MHYNRLSNILKFGLKILLLCRVLLRWRLI